MSSESPWQPKAVSGPILQPPRATWLTYEGFYGLRDKPFSLASDPAFFYNSRSHAKAFEDLQSGIRRRESLSVLSGDIGTGKTTLCRAVLQKLDRKTFSSFVPDPFASREDLLKIVLMDFGVVSADDLMAGRLKTASRTELSYLLYEFLGTLSPLQAFAVVFIDEAQNLSVPLLEEIRILSDSDGRERQLQVVLVGQLELRDKLRLPEMRQVDQRVSVRCALAALDQAGVAGYVEHRLEVAGGRSDRVSFTPDAIQTVYEASGGVPRLINRICDRALHQGHIRQTAIIDRGMVAVAISDMEIAPVPVTGVVVTAPAQQRWTPEPALASAPAAVHASAPAYDSAQAHDPVSAQASAPPRDSGPASETEPGFGQARVSEPVDNWFARVDRSVGIADATVPSRDSGVEDALPPFSESDAHRDRKRIVPLTRMEGLIRRWVRRAQIAAILAVVLGGAGFGLTTASNILRSQTTEDALPTLPAEPHGSSARKATIVPPAGAVTYSLQLPAVDTLKGAQDGALPDPATHQPVVIGSFATREEAESALVQIHQVPGFESAVAVETPSR